MPSHPHHRKRQGRNAQLRANHRPLFQTLRKGIATTQTERFPERPRNPSDRQRLGNLHNTEVAPPELRHVAGAPKESRMRNMERAHRAGRLPLLPLLHPGSVGKHTPLPRRELRTASKTHTSETKSAHRNSQTWRNRSNGNQIPTQWKHSWRIYTHPPMPLRCGPRLGAGNLPGTPFGASLPKHAVETNHSPQPYARTP